MGAVDSHHPDSDSLSPVPLAWYPFLQILQADQQIENCKPGNSRSSNLRSVRQGSVGPGIWEVGRLKGLRWKPQRPIAETRSRWPPSVLMGMLLQHDGEENGASTLLVPEVFAGVSGVAPSRQGRTGNRGAPSERGSSFSNPPSSEPSPVRESNRRTAREQVSRGPWISGSPGAIPFPAQTSSNVCLSAAWQSEDSERGARLKATSPAEGLLHNHVSRPRRIVHESSRTSGFTRSA